jgi:hypothetical protein
MDSRFINAMASIPSATECTQEYLLGYRRALQRVFYGAQAVADAEHEAWLKLGNCGNDRWAERFRGYCDGTTAASETFDGDV